MEKKGKIKKLDKTQIYFILKGIFVGLLTGIVVSLFRLSIEKLSDLVRSIYEMSREQPIYLIGLAICCILAAFFVGYLVKNEPDIKGSGIPNDLLGGNPIYESLLERLLGNTQTASLKGARTTFDFPVTAESSLDGLMVRDFNWPKNMLLISIRRGNQEILTHGDTIMNVGDILVILTDEANLPRIKQEIEAKSSITNLKQSF